jgi:hypothetical protein
MDANISSQDLNKWPTKMWMKPGGFFTGMMASESGKRMNPRSKLGTIGRLEPICLAGPLPINPAKEKSSYISHVFIHHIDIFINMIINQIALYLSLLKFHTAHKMPKIGSWNSRPLFLTLAFWIRKYK